METTLLEDKLMTTVKMQNVTALGTSDSICGDLLSNLILFIGTKFREKKYKWSKCSLMIIMVLYVVKT